MEKEALKLSRDSNIDALKGFAILLVVLGHAIQAHVPHFDDNLLFRLIYSFHMPLFMFLSGYVAWDRPIKLGKKFVRLVVPFITWYLALYVLFAHRTIGFEDYIIRWLKSPDYGLWFLWCCF